MGAEPPLYRQVASLALKRAFFREAGPASRPGTGILLLTRLLSHAADLTAVCEKCASMVSRPPGRSRVLRSASTSAVSKNVIPRYQSKAVSPAVHPFSVKPQAGGDAEIARNLRAGLVPGLSEGGLGWWRTRLR
jgi:hypothetical protein